MNYSQHKSLPAQSIHLSSGIEPMLNMGDIAQILRRSTRTVRHWRAEGFLPVADLTHGKTILWRQSTIQGWLDTLSSQPAPRM